MANAPPKRNKVKLEPISLAELEADSTMTGFTSIFRIPTTGAPLPQVVGAEQDPLAKSRKPTVGDSTKPTVEIKSEPTVGPGIGLGPAFFQAEDGSLYPRQRVRPLQQPRDILSPVELRVFETLERLAEPARELRIGYDRLADSCSLNEKSVRLLLVRLQDKGFLSVQAPADPSRQMGKLYRLHSIEEAGNWHQRKGWRWVVRSGKGVLVVQPVP